jgi:hypothetical protein
MPQKTFDKSSKWLLEHHGDAILYLGGMRNPRRWRARPAEVVQPARLPDGLLEVTPPGQKKPDYCLVEIATYPEKRVLQRALDDLALTYVHLRVLPELLVLVLSPKGRYRVEGRREVQSKLNWSRLVAEWKVVELWTVAAEELLASGVVGVVPWATLARFEGPPEALLRQCEEQITRQAPPGERDSLLAVSQVLARLRFPNEELLSILGGKQVMTESPIIKQLLAETTQKAILQVLEARFGTVPVEISTRLRRVRREKTLDELVKYAALCPDLDAFRERLLR